MLELEGVSAAGIGAELGIEEISLQVRQGEVLGIAGERVLSFGSEVPPAFTEFVNEILSWPRRSR